MQQIRTTGLDTPVGVDLTGRAPSATQLALVDPPRHGTVTMGPDGTAVYTPDRGYSGVDSFTYRFTGGSGVAVSGTVQIHVGTALPRTGAETGQVVVVALALLLGGLLLLVVGRRRTEDEDPAAA